MPINDHAAPFINVVLTHPLPDEAEQRFMQQLGAQLNREGRPLTQTEILARLTAYSDCPAVLSSTPGMAIDRTLIQQLPESVKLIANFGAGVEKVDLNAARERGIMVSNTPSAVAEDTADLTMGIIIATCRRLAEGDALVRSGQWKGSRPTFMLGTQVNGKTLGIIGLGGIGKAVAKRARAFNMSILYHNRTPSKAAESLGAEWCGCLDELLQRSDIVSLHCPLTPETRHLINRNTLSQMKPSAILVNTSRGAVVCEEDLVWALEENIIRAVGLDVYEFEPQVSEALRKLPNTVLIPHLGTASLEARNAMGFRVIDNILHWKKTGRPLDQVV